MLISRRKEKNTEDFEKKYMKCFAENMELKYKIREFEAEINENKIHREEIMEIHEKARRLKHDMKNHVMVLASYLHENEVTEAKKYISKVMDRLNEAYTYIDTGNLLMNHIVNQKLEKAQKMGIKFKIKIENIAFRRMDSVDFSSVLTNLLDNAIEAEKEIENPEIFLDISNCKGFDVIKIKNNIEKSILKKNPELVSTKAVHEQHGLGVLQVKNLTDKYSGYYDFYEEEDKFFAVIMIPE